MHASVALERAAAVASPAFGERKDWDRLLTMDGFGQWSGFASGRTAIGADYGALVFVEVDGHAVAHLDREPVGVLVRTERARMIALAPRADTMDVLLDDQGRADSGAALGEAMTAATPQVRAAMTGRQG